MQKPLILVRQGDPPFEQVQKLFDDGWQGIAPPIRALYRIAHAPQQDSRLLFSIFSSTCPTMNDDEWLTSPKLCSSDCDVCSPINSYFDVNRDSPTRSEHRTFGTGIYTTPSSYHADRCSHSTSWNGEGLRGLLISQVSSSRPFRTHKAGRYTAPPPGNDAIIGLPGIDFKFQETVVFDPRLICPAYVVIYGNPTPPRLPPGVGTASEIPSAVQVPPLSQATSAPASSSTSSANPPSQSGRSVINLPSLTRLINLIKLDTNLPKETISARVRVLQAAVKQSEDGTAANGEIPEQIFLDVMQDILDHPTIWHRAYSSEDKRVFLQVRDLLRRLIMRISLDTGKLPAALFLQGVVCDTSSRSTSILGSGSFGDVFQGRLHDPPLDVAVKRIKIHRSMSAEKIASLRKDIQKEALSWKNLSHPFILPFLGVSETVDPIVPCMITPFMPEGNIRQAMDKIRANGLKTDRQLFVQIHAWLRDIVSAVVYLHGEKLVHADLRGPNILMDIGYSVRVADFGIAQFSQSVRSSTLGGNSDVIGQNRWAAPELIEDDSTPTPTFASDVYSLAYVVVELYTCKDPYSQAYPSWGDFQIFNSIVNGKLHPRPNFVDGTQMPNALWDLLKRCWAFDPTQRPQAEEVARLVDEAIAELG